MIYRRRPTPRAFTRAADVMALARVLLEKHRPPKAKDQGRHAGWKTDWRRAFDEEIERRELKPRGLVQEAITTAIFETGGLGAKAFDRAVVGRGEVLDGALSEVVGTTAEKESEKGGDASEIADRVCKILEGDGWPITETVRYRISRTAEFLDSAHVLLARLCDAIRSAPTLTDDELISVAVMLLTQVPDPALAPVADHFDPDSEGNPEGDFSDSYLEDYVKKAREIVDASDRKAVH